jgi:hypothetical protein
MMIGVEQVQERTSRKYEKHICWKTSIYEGGCKKSVHKKIYHTSNKLLTKKCFCIRSIYVYRQWWQRADQAKLYYKKVQDTYVPFQDGQ